MRGNSAAVWGWSKRLLQSFQELGENQEWDYCQDPAGKLPLWKSFVSLCDRLTEYMEEHREAVKKDREERSVMVAELKKISSCLEAAESRKEPLPPPSMPPKMTPPLVRSKGEQPTTPPKATPLTPSMVGEEARQTLPPASSQPAMSKEGSQWVPKGVYPERPGLNMPPSAPPEELQRQGYYTDRGRNVAPNIFRNIGKLPPTLMTLSPIRVWWMSWKKGLRGRVWRHCVCVMRRVWPEPHRPHRTPSLRRTRSTDYGSPRDGCSWAGLAGPIVSMRLFVSEEIRWFGEKYQLIWACGRRERHAVR